MTSTYLEGLNPRQKEAVSFGEGAILVLAGAGSGKTRVLTSRIAHLIFERGIAEENIMAVTFTNKAAGEMRQRVKDLLGKGWLSCQIGTFHSFCARVLRSHIEILGLWNGRFTIYDRGDQKALIRSVLKELFISEKSFPIPVVISRFSTLKKKEIGSEEFILKTPNDPLANIYYHYTRKCIENNAMDFDDLIFYTLRIFDRFPKIMDNYQRRFKYILVDEFQDTTPSQYRLIKMLGAPESNLLMVGDDDQSIYRFRGVETRVFEKFKRDFPQRHLVKLEENYRSTQTILEAANHVIARNSSREGKKLWTKLGEGDKILLQESENEQDEAKGIASYIQKAAKKGGYGEFVLLYRANAQSRPLEEALKSSGIPYLIVGGTRFYERKEVKDILAYLCLVENPGDAVAFKRIINFPSRGIGNKTVALVEEEARQSGVSLFDALHAIIQRDPLSSLAKKIIPFAGIFSEIPPNSSISDIAKTIVERAGIFQHYLSDPSPESQARLENIKEFFSATKEFDQSGSEGGMSGFLEQVRLVSDADAIAEAGAVTLMTVHCAKGLEFPVVVVTGMEEGIFPIVQSFGDPEQYEEERRLFYVAITRAQKQLVLTCCRRRLIYGTGRSYQKSKFLKDIPEALIKKDKRFSMNSAKASVYGKKPVFTYSTRDEYAVKERIKSPEIPPVESFDKKYKTGKEVFHPIWGNGKIVKVEGQGMDMNLIVGFSGGRKKLKARYAHLALIS